MSCKTDRERLMELLMNGILNNLGTVFQENVEPIADYLLANGVIVPPCKVGTKVYVITSQTSDNKNLYIFEDIVSHYCIGEHCSIMAFDKHLGVHSWSWDKVFLTKEEAEAELRKRSVRNNGLL